jgi:hypothetical protein
MPNTYSIFIGEVIESTSKEDLFGLLELLPDNTQKLISPRDARDAFLTTWANSTFKLTSTTGQNQYIGIDTGNPVNRDVKAKILLGKRSVGSFDVMSDALLNKSDTDIFFFNTKQDGVSQDKTKISILAGTNRLLYPSSPYLETVREEGSDTLSFNIVNPNPGGTLNISSSDIVNINGISFPTIADNSTNAQNGKILKYSGIYPFGSLEWAELEVGDVQIGSPGSETNIYGDPVNLNGFSLEFIENDIVPEDIGDIKQGESFPANSFDDNGDLDTPQDWPISEVLRRVLYPEINPELEFDLSPSNNKYVEIGDTNTKSFTFSIKSFPRKPSERVSSWFIRNIPNTGAWNIITQGGPLSDIPGDTFSSSITTQINKQFTGEFEYELLVSTRSDLTLSPSNSIDGYDYKKRITLESIKPFFTIITDDNDIASSAISPQSFKLIIEDASTIKIVDTYPEEDSIISLSFDGQGYIIFAQSVIYPPVKQIKDNNGFVIYDIDDTPLSSFQVSTLTPSSPFTYYGGFRVYRCINRITTNYAFNLQIIY